MDLEQKRLSREMSFLPPPPPPPSFAGERECRGRLLGFTVDQMKHKPWGGFQSGGGCGGGFGPPEKNEGDGFTSSSREEHQQQGGFIVGKDLDSVESRLCSRGHWRPAEDAKLRELVAQYGPQNWNVIAEKLDGRSGKSCRLRWFNQLDPRINRRAFGEEEEERLLAAHRLYGNKWALIARLFPGRTDNAVKNHWHVIMARKQREQSSAYRRRKPAPFAATTTQPLAQRFEINASRNNACSGESTITSAARDESASTCTDLSLSPSSNTVGIHGFFSRFSPPLHRQQPFEFLRGSVEKMGRGLLTNGLIRNLQGNDPQHGGGAVGITTMTVVGGADDPCCCYSDSNSEASAIESGSNITKKDHNHNNGCGEAADHGSEFNLPFIDFLGVGAR